MWVQCVRYQMGHMGNWHYLMAPLASQFKHIVVLELKMLIFNAHHNSEHCRTEMHKEHTFRSQHEVLYIWSY